MYEAEKDIPHAILSLDPQCHGLGFSPDGRSFALASLTTPRGFSITQPAVPSANALQHPDWVFDARFSSDGQYLLTACRDGMARVWNWKDRQLVGPPMEHRDEVLAAAFTPDGQWVVTASLDRTARAWDWPTGKPLTPPLPLSGRGLNVAVTLDSKYAVVGGFVDALEVICLEDLSSYRSWTTTISGLLAELRSGQRVHDGGGVNNLTATEWLNRWQLFHRAIRTTASLEQMIAPVGMMANRSQHKEVQGSACLRSAESLNGRILRLDMTKSHLEWPSKNSGSWAKRNFDASPLDSKKPASPNRPTGRQVVIRQAIVRAPLRGHRGRAPRNGINRGQREMVVVL